MKEDALVLTEAARLVAEGTRFALVTVVRTAGSTPRKAGAKMLVLEDGRQVGTVGGGALEGALLEEARAALASGEPRLFRRHLTRELAMCCGGEVEAFVDPMGRKERLLLVGGGHVNAALAAVGAQLGFEVWVIDETEERTTAEHFPQAAKRLTTWAPKRWGAPFDRDTYVVIATRDHAVDQQVLEELAQLDARPAYLGVIGSRGKLARFRKRLEARGVTEPWLAQLRGPIGLPVGAETPAEIAVSVAAELVAVRRGVDLTPPAPLSREGEGRGEASSFEAIHSESSALLPPLPLGRGGAGG